MNETREVVVADLQQVRCVYWLGEVKSGQQVKCWLPTGAYWVDGFEVIVMSDRGAALVSDAARVVGWNDGGTYWVHPASLQELRESTRFEEV